jgi:hypothetical protein
MVLVLSARGSDLLFVEELKKIGGSVRVLLPFREVISRRLQWAIAGKMTSTET